MGRGKVVLDQVGCCAMIHAFLRHPSHVREWSHAVGQLHVLYEIFTNTLSLSFTPNEEAVAVYGAFARAEISRLKRGGSDRLMCRHGAARHIGTLETFLASLPKASSH